ncbi:MAG: valine--tRNA ligase [Acidobacteria bacterium]|nr:valine--tRNA ligase [Acidobacteriota bacterium]
MNLEKAFQPEAYEPRVGRMWEAAGLFRATGAGAVRFSLVIPPPNVTGTLHMGHALDYTLQDIVVRWHRMLGHDTLWVPGSDHAGIATQMVVERQLRAEGTSRHELGREKFVERAWQWKEEYHDRIVSTLNRLGCSCDWSRERFTLDPGFSHAVRETFVRLHEQGLVYRGARLINWCPSCRTALSDLEVDRDDPEPGEMWSFAYPVQGGGEIVVATTRPETMLGDTAVAVHPDDPRWQALIGRAVEHPFFPERHVPIIGDAILADPETGTGAVKVTPAHDPNDFACGKRHDLPEISIIAEDGSLNANAGPFAGLDRFVAREQVKAALAERGLSRGSRPHSYAPGRCQRCRTIVEPIVSTQWFVRMQPLAGPALEAVRDGRIRFVPDSWEKTYFHWLENIQDWCISRQLWWGHRIPAWYCQCGEMVVAREAPARCPRCGAESPQQDADVLDTWFSSQLWPFGVFGWPDATPELSRYYPTDVLVTGFDIIFFWVARMIMAGLRLTGEVPFRTVLYHGLVRDAHGQKMSKSRGNAVEPEEAMARHGVDALRFTLAAQASPGSDLALTEERLAGYRAFMNKLWNATRFVLMRLPENAASARADYRADELDDLDRYLLGSYLDVVDEVERSMQTFRYDHACEQIYHFLWHTFCDWSIELAKPDLFDGGGSRRAQVRLAVLLDVLDGALRLLHPVAPFITEELWQHLPRRPGDPPQLAIAAYPRPDAPALPEVPRFDRAAARQRVERWLIEPVSAARMLRTSSGIPPSRKVALHLRPRSDDGLEPLGAFRERIAALANADEVVVGTGPADGTPALRQVLDDVEVAIPLAGAVDVAQERARLERELGKLLKDLEAVRKKLDNPGFVERAPAEVVEKERARVAALESRRGEIERLLAALP